jgi:hypothetical protein
LKGRASAGEDLRAASREAGSSGIEEHNMGRVEDRGRNEQQGLEVEDIRNITWGTPQ